MHNLEILGWNDALAEAFGPHEREGRCAARVTSEHKNLYRVTTATNEAVARVSGRLRHDERFPAVGDWVAITFLDPENATIHDILPRRGHFTRLAAGAVTRPQVVAANVDVVFLVQGLDGDFNPRRLERYLLVAWEGGSRPVVVMNKADDCAEVEARRALAEEVAMGVPVHLISALRGTGMESLDIYLQPGFTLAVLGSSGAGKSTLVNRLLGHDALRTQAVRATDQHGRHTTTHRQLLPLPGGAMIIDTPGMRELQVVDGDALDAAFADVASLAAACRFHDCAHDGEPGCAVRAALDEGTLPAERLASWRKLQREQRHAASRTDERLRIEEKLRWKAIHRQLRARPPKGM